MTKQEFIMVMAGLKSNYPNWKINLNDKLILEFWYQNLKDIPYSTMQMGVMKLVAEEEFYPNIAKVRKACMEVTDSGTTDSTEAWGLVKQAIRKFGYMRAEEAMKSLPKDVANAVLRMGGFQELCKSENIEADRAHFYRSMDQISEKRKINNLLPGDLRKAIELNRKDSSKLQLGEKRIEHAMIENKTESVTDKELEQQLNKIDKGLSKILKRQII